MPTTVPTTAPTAAMNDPVVLLVILMSAIAVVAILSSIFGGGRKRRGKSQTWVEEERQRKAVQRREMERQGIHIIATSSTAAIAGFEIVRQIEAVFTEGHSSPQDAVAALKAAAAEKGANAVINLSGQRQGTGKCAAHGDAVMVKPIEGSDKPPASAEPATDETPDTGDGSTGKSV